MRKLCACTYLALVLEQFDNAKRIQVDAVFCWFFGVYEGRLGKLEYNEKNIPCISCGFMLDNTYSIGHSLHICWGYNLPAG